MSFKFDRFFYLAISYIFGAFCFLIGLIGLVLPWSDTLQQGIINLILKHTLIFSLFGMGLTLISISVVVYAVMNTGKKYASIRVGKRSVMLSEAVINRYLDEYWLKNFPNQQIAYYVNIKNQSIQLAADLPFVPEDKQQEVLKTIQMDFEELFGKIIGYPGEILLLVHFQ